MTRPSAVAFLSGSALLALAVGGGATVAEPSLAELLTSAGEYVLAYEDAFRVVVAEEVYVQRLRASPGGPVQQTRRLTSDVAFVRAPGTALPWWLLRDVYEADGGVVRDRQARLERPELAGARGRSGSVELVEGLASYRGFRQAGVSMEEELRLPGPGGPPTTPE